MSPLPIVTGADNPILRRKNERVPKVTKEIKKLLRDMADSMTKEEGAGIAAPQVGVNVRVCIAVIDEKARALINPDITWKSDELTLDEEGCLSLPGLQVTVPRAREITVKYLDLQGKEQERRLADFNARVVQHEVDHLDGVLISDYAPVGTTT
ncbi:MAG: peptide deformylase [Candidatus Peribacteraceae bacterium]|nr:peptide deformylase [Candidatus Peribacteraceae bacterium]